jgi:GntR family transcriptional regulator
LRKLYYNNSTVIRRPDVIRVDASSFVPIYEQIKQGIVRLVATGRLKAGEPLPSIRDLAAEIIVNPNTVARAYRELEQEGVIATQKGRGSVVAERARPDAERVLRAHLGRIMDGAVAEARRFDLDDDAIRGLVEERLRRVAEKKRGGRHE